MTGRENPSEASQGQLRLFFVDVCRTFGYCAVPTYVMTEVKK